MESNTTDMREAFEVRLTEDHEWYSEDYIDQYGHIAASLPTLSLTAFKYPKGTIIKVFIPKGEQ